MSIFVGTALGFATHNPAYIFFSAAITYVIIFRCHDSAVVAIKGIKAKLKRS